MRAKWALLVVLGGMCAWGRAEIFLYENSGVYNDPNDYEVDWQDPDPNDPNNPLQPLITIKDDIDGVPFWFICQDETGQLADIYGITALDDVGVIQVQVLNKSGTGPGARDVGELLFNGDGVHAWIPAFYISGTLGTLGVASNVDGVTGLFIVSDLGAPFAVDEMIAEGGALRILEPGPNCANLSVKSLVASPYVGAELEIFGDYPGTLTLGSLG